MAECKTNTMRTLDKLKINYNHYEYDHSDGAIDGISVANKLNQDINKVFKTLVTRGASKEIYVFLIPVAKELNLKNAAKAVGEKSIDMIHVDEINKITGYIRGGCSPIGMKKLFKTVVDSTAQELDTIIVSAGKVGYQIELASADLIKITNGRYESITH